MSYQAERVYGYQGDQPAVLVDRLWPRGISKARISGVSWVKDVTPSAALRTWFHQDRDARFDDFCRLYRKELARPEIQTTLDQLRHLEQDQGKLILLTAAKDMQHCHIPVLISVLADSNARMPNGIAS